MIALDPNVMKQMAVKGKRLDNRKFDEYRKITIEAGIIPMAEGSARVRLGDTEVVAGVKMAVGTPFSDTPNEGVLIVAAEFVPLASFEFESGPPGEEAVEVSRVVDRAIRESKVIEFEKLCITPGEKVWMINVDVNVMNHDGNLIDAVGIAAAAAILNARIPQLNEDGKVEFGVKTDEKLPIKGIPVSTTIVKIGSSLMADPSFLEESAFDARLTIGTFEKNGSVAFCSMQKGGSHGLTLEELDKALDMAVEKGKEIRALLK
ncbi:MAG: exosome complex protein Rrp42 [Candidatus Aenigmarchaeota archaeon]|nr:exosome complex protein Rrp42 [Candidatus Aenigmarchaeota archaeon]